jgi:hypothetical protein
MIHLMLNRLFIACLFIININYVASDPDDHTTINKDEKLQLCLESFPYMTARSDCWTIIFVKLLGIAIIAGACLSKAPFILNIINSKSAVGLSRPSVYGEVISM